MERKNRGKEDLELVLGRDTCLGEVIRDLTFKESFHNFYRLCMADLEYLLTLTGVKIHQMHTIERCSSPGNVWQ